MNVPGRGTTARCVNTVSSIKVYVNIYIYIEIYIGIHTHVQGVVL